MGLILWWTAGLLLYAVPRRRPDTSWMTDVWEEVIVGSFKNSLGGPCGDVQGVIDKLDYLQSLYVRVLWLGPIFESPQLDGGYDVSDWFKIHHWYGDVDLLTKLIKEAHRRGIRVVLDLPLNHASIRNGLISPALDPSHPKHRQARRLLLWSRDGKRYPLAPNPFKDFTDNWTLCEPIAENYRERRQRWREHTPGWLRWLWLRVPARLRSGVNRVLTWRERPYYMNTFYYHQADLNFRNPRVGILILRVLWFYFTLVAPEVPPRWQRRWDGAPRWLRFIWRRYLPAWLKWMVKRVAFGPSEGVDGFRLDAIRHIFKGGTSQGRPEAHIFLAFLRWLIDWVFPGRILMGEAYEPPQRLAKYWGSKRRPECHALYGFTGQWGTEASSALRGAVPLNQAVTKSNTALRGAPADSCELVSRGVHDDTPGEHEDPVLVWAVQRERARRHPNCAFNWGTVGRPAARCGDDWVLWKSEWVDIILRGRAVVFLYGDEIGLWDNMELLDRDGVRTLMPWGPWRWGGWSKDENPALLYPGLIAGGPHGYQKVNVEMQEYDPDSPLHFSRRALALRRHPWVRPLVRSAPVELVGCSDPQAVFTYCRPAQDSALFFMRNCVRDGAARPVELDLRRWIGWEHFDLTPTLAREALPKPLVVPASGRLAVRLASSDYRVLIARRKPSDDWHSLWHED